VKRTLSMLGLLFCVCLVGCQRPAVEAEPFDYARIDDICREYGYPEGDGVILETGEGETKLLLYHHQIASADQLTASLVTVAGNGAVIWEEKVAWPDELLGHGLSIKAVGERHLLGYRTRVDDTQKKRYADLFVVETARADLQGIRFLQSFEQNYDPSEGIVAQAEIPAIIDCTVNIVGDYIVYEDVDEYWKVQDMTSGRVFASAENNCRTAEIEPDYQLVDGYIYVLKYKQDGSILAFNLESKSFERLPPAR
jgi:hypothetical protein